jgi:dUTP pyrophosphatase
MKVKIKRLHKDAVIPKYAKPGDAGLDLVATNIISFDKEQVVYGTGIAVEIPEGYVGLVFPRSSIRKYEQYLSNSVGVIDSGYRGEIQATFNSRFYADVKYNVGDKIAQLIIMPYPHIDFEEVDELSETERADGGHGSTGN